MNSLGLIILLAASWVNTAFGKSNLYTGWTQKLDGEPYADLTAQVGDTITFIWPIDQIQNIFIHPTNNCTQTGRIAIGNQSPTEYTFKPEDGAPGGKTIFFANDIGDRCENYGMRLIVTVFPASDGGDVPGVNLTPEPIPTLPPTFPPIAPTQAPVFPTLPPIAPTLAPVVPTNAPVAPTAFPTKRPTLPPTARPTSTPTNAPTPTPTFVPTFPPTEEANDALERKIMRGLQMTLSGIASFSEEAMEGWAKETAAFCTSFYVNDINGSTFQTAIAVTNAVASPASRRLMRGSERILQTDEVVVTYNQVVSYANTGDAVITEDYLAKAPFGTSDQIDSFVGALQNTNVPDLEAVTDASPVTFADEIVPTSAPVASTPVNIRPTPSVDPKEGFSLSLAAIIGISCGGGALIIIAILFYIYCRTKKSKDASRNESSPPPNVSIKPDEVSTLAGPSIPGNYGDRSIGTVDYDYTKAYEDRDHSVSYAGGTLGSDTQDFSFPANAGATGAALGPYDDDGAFGDNFRNSRGKFKEEILHVFAPPGKLGVVIDTPDDGAPVVHAVKETSVVVEKVKVGDKLVAVDDEDVRTLTAIKVSKLISRKSANPSRKLTVLRRTHIG